ncbi:MAG: DUF4956 domain-containing protein [Corynebacterium sp.]|nr:DUF4956 domain-containing protein [Corynebacterium sp.]
MMLAVDLIAIAILVFGVYFPRHRRADLVVAFLGVNIGVLAVTEVLASSAAGAGLGLGLFGVLSIIRLRSDEITQREVAYYFSSLAIALIAGLNATPTPMALGMVALVIGVLAIVDTGLVGRFGTSTMQIQLDRALSSPVEITAEAERTLGFKVVAVDIIKVDLVNDSTLINARVRTGIPVRSMTAEATGEKAYA